MLDREGYEHYLRGKFSIQNKLSEIGAFRGSAEAESQIQFIEERLVARIKQAHHHARQEMDSLRMVLIESTKDA